MKNILLFGIFLLALSSSFAQEKELNKILDQWHKDAAEGNFESYFAPTADNFVFLGTDPKERWSKDEFMSFCKPYFEDGKGWDFKVLDRNWIFIQDGEVAILDENLQTWMDECRGSGVFVLENGNWKMVQYNLTVLIENEKIESFIELRKATEE